MVPTTNSGLDYVDVLQRALTDVWTRAIRRRGFALEPLSPSFLFVQC